MDFCSPLKRSLPADIQSDPTRRKCRKGTQSCWACKKRKVRCIFASTDAICDRCKIKNIACISQDFPDEPGSVNSNSPLHERLGRVEALIDRLARKVDISDEAHDRTIWPGGFCKQNTIVCTPDVSYLGRPAPDNSSGL
jgi:hypothetical protein